MAVLPAGPAPHLNPELLRRCLRGAARLVAGALFALAMGSSAAEDTVTLNFVNADIDAVVKAASEITGRNFVLDPKIKGTINIVSARPVPRELVYPTLLSALRLQGIIAVEGNGVTKLVMEADAKQQGSEVMRGPISGSGDRLVTQVVTLRFESALQLVNVLRPLISPNNTIAAYPGTNALIITDYADNLRRIDKIIASLDVPPTGEPLVVTLKYASAIDLVPLLNRLVGAETATQGGQPGDAQQRIMIVADPRSNSVLLRSDNPGSRGAHQGDDRAARYAAARRRQHVHRLPAQCRRCARRANAARTAVRRRRRRPADERAHAIDVRQPDEQSAGWRRQRGAGGARVRRRIRS